MKSIPIEGNICFKTPRPQQNGRHFADDIFKCIFIELTILYFDKKKISLQIVLKGPNDNK